MKKIIIILAAVMLFAACEKQNDSKPTWEDPGILWTVRFEKHQTKQVKFYLADDGEYNMEFVN